MPSRAEASAGVWVEIALSLAGVTLAVLILNAGVFWLHQQRGQQEQHTELSLSHARALQAHLEGVRDPSAWSRSLKPYRRMDPKPETLWVVDRDLTPLARVAGTPPAELDEGLRAALYARSEHIAVEGRTLPTPRVIVTAPIIVGGAVQAAVRLELSWGSSTDSTGRLWFFLLYTLGSGFVLAAFGYARLRRRLILPLDELQQVTQRIAAGGFGEELELESVSELRSLSADLSQLSRSLHQYRSDTRAQLVSLEEANQRLQAMQAELVQTEKMASLGRLAGGLAHELGNPLAAALGFCALLRQELGDPQLEQELLESTHRELQRVESILRRTLDFARVNTLSREQLDLGLFLKELLKRYEKHPDYQGIQWTLSLPETEVTLLSSPEALEQILDNLIANARDAMEGAGRIALVAELDGRELRIQIEDQGPGLPREERARLREPFFTTKPPGEGTGLGLAICARLAEDLGGDLRLTDGEEGGALAALSLPLEGV